MCLWFTSVEWSSSGTVITTSLNTTPVLYVIKKNPKQQVLWALVKDIIQGNKLLIIKKKSSSWSPVLIFGFFTLFLCIYEIKHCEILKIWKLAMFDHCWSWVVYVTDLLPAGVQDCRCLSVTYPAGCWPGPLHSWPAASRPLLSASPWPLWMCCSATWRGKHSLPWSPASTCSKCIRYILMLVNDKNSFNKHSECFRFKILQKMFIS